MLTYACMQEPEDAPWVYNPVRECYLTPEQLHMIRSHLFGGAASAAAPLSSRLTDFDLAQLLMCCTGAWPQGPGLLMCPGNMSGSINVQQVTTSSTDAGIWLSASRWHSSSFAIELQFGTAVTVLCSCP